MTSYSPEQLPEPQTMQDIKDIKIIGIDEDRPPMVRKEAYVDLYFKLSKKAPVDWCEDFNILGHQITPPVKINPANGIFVETYVRDVNQIQEHLNKIKDKIKLCIEKFLEKERQKQLALAEKSANLHGTSSKQDELNKIIAQLNYEIQ
jgi:hypothetical protein